MTIEEMEAEIRDQRTHQAEEKEGSRAAADATGTGDVPGGDASRRVYCVRLLQLEQCGRVLFSPGTGRLCQHGQGQGGGDDSVRRDRPNQARQNDSGIQMRGSRDPGGTVLRNVPSSRSNPVHQVPGAQAT